MGSLISQNIPYSGVTLSQQSLPIGAIVPYMGLTAPSGYLACDGTVYSISLYPLLVGFIETQFGSINYFGGNGTSTFAVPDLRGEFIRGAGTNSHANQGSGGNPGEHQDGTELISMYIDASGNLQTSNVQISAYGNNGNSDSSYSPGTKWSEHPASNQYSGGFNAIRTARPTNTSFIYLVKAKSDRLDKITFAEVDDTSTADDVVWSAEKTREAIGPESYSTSEQWTGKRWIDGKKIYSKTFTHNDVSLGATLLSNVAEIIDFKCRHTPNSTDTTYNLMSDGGAAEQSGTTGALYPRLKTDNTVAISVWGGTYSGYIHWAYFEYTKTNE